ncbi:hypothetical protein Hanom_Chr12g01145961 [Helianthus anomalus]
MCANQGKSLSLEWVQTCCPKADFIESDSTLTTTPWWLGTAPWSEMGHKIYPNWRHGVCWPEHDPVESFPVGTGHVDLSTAPWLEFYEVTSVLILRFLFRSDGYLVEGTTPKCLRYLNCS